VRLTARPVGVVVAVVASGEPVYVCARLLSTTVAVAFSTVNVTGDVLEGRNPSLLV
jgi:hypothetical protein